MTIEEKAKCYDEAFERARGKYAQFEGMLPGDVLEDVFPELKENEDERIRNFISNELACLRATDGKGSDRYNELTEAIAWLEKQGEQKPADKVEPKFKVGDWIVYKQLNILYVIGLYDSYYNVVDEQGRGYNYHGQAMDSDCHLWTIKDAKDGDVLYTSSTASNEAFIFKGLTIEGYIECYCSYDSEDKYREGKYHFIGRPTFMTHPATKEQRDLLFSKMKEAGYEWDAEKKELKKIEDDVQLTEFEYELKNMMNAYRDAIGANDVTIEEIKKHAAYMLSLIPQKSAEWSEEDEEALLRLTSFIEDWDKISKGKKSIQQCTLWSSDEHLAERLLNFLNSLRPKTTWKPSDEQMDALETATSSLQSTALESLYNELKKL